MADDAHKEFQICKADRATCHFLKHCNRLCISIVYASELLTSPTSCALNSLLLIINFTL